MKPNNIVLLSTCMEISVNLSCLYVYEPPYKTGVVCFNPIFCHSSSHMDHLMSKWGSLRFAPTNYTPLADCTHAVISCMLTITISKL